MSQILHFFIDFHLTEIRNEKKTNYIACFKKMFTFNSF